MSSAEPTEPYVYQPFCSVTDKAHAAAGRLWGVGFPYSTHQGLTTIKGLTKEEAIAICSLLKVSPPTHDLQPQLPRYGEK